MARHRTAVAAILAMVFCLAPLAREIDAQRPTLDGLLSAYVGGDFDVLKSTFRRSTDIQDVLHLNKPRDLERWLGSWNPGKALLLLEFARMSKGVAPQHVARILGAGRHYTATAQGTDAGSDQTADFVQMWHRAAAGVLQGATEPVSVEEYVPDPGRANGGPPVAMDPRLLLARAIAQERRCWANRPSLDQTTLKVDALLEAAGVRVPDDSGGPFRSQREATLAKHSACLREAVSRFEAAAALEDVAAEARVRGGWALVQDGRAAEAIAWLDAANPRDDRDLEYWRALFRGRALDALGRFEDSATAYRAALVLYPRAQAAGTGLTIALLHLDRTKEADEISRFIRAAEATTPDPWLHYPRGDERFTTLWIDSLRQAVR